MFGSSVLQCGARHLVAGVGAVLLGLAIPTAAQADAVVSAPAPAATDRAAIAMLDTTFGDDTSPLYFQVVGEGFAPGEVVTLQATVVPAPPEAGQPWRLRPVQVVANHFGQIAATIDGDGYLGPGQGYIIRARGGQRSASIIDFVLDGASVQPAGGD